MNRTLIHGLSGLIVFGALCGTLSTWLASAANRAEEQAESVRKAKTASLETTGGQGEVAHAAAANAGFCTPELKQILKRVLTSCGLVKEGQKRGCQPLQAKNVASMSGDDFNALFKPMADRASIIQFGMDKSDLDPSAVELLDKTFADQRGASYFLIVARASPEGSVQHNRELSGNRAKALFTHLQEKYKDPDLEQEVGMLWLGEEFAQLDQEFCKWRRSGVGAPAAAPVPAPTPGSTEAGGAATTTEAAAPPPATCSAAELNRSAFIAWIDCRL